MKRRFRTGLMALGLLGLVVSVLTLGFTGNSLWWGKSRSMIQESEIRFINIHPSNNATLFVGTSKALYVSTDQGKSFRVVLTPQGEKKGVNAVFVAPDDTRIYAATDSGLYMSEDEAGSWKRVYYDSDEKRRVCLSVLEDQARVYLGTEGGLFYKNVSASSWSYIDGIIGSRAVYELTVDDGALYVLVDDAVLQFDAAKNLATPFFSSGRINIAEDELLTDEMDEDTTSAQNVLSFSIINLPSKIFFAATRHGIFFKDAQHDWQLLPTANLPIRDLTSLGILENSSEAPSCQNPISCLTILAGTKKGVFVLAGNRWNALYQGMEANEVYDLASDAQNIYAATNKGVFYLPVEKALFSGDTSLVSAEPQLSSEQIQMLDHIDDYFSYEPNIVQVHRLAIDYAEVNPQKIQEWRNLARKRAWYPSVNLGADVNRDWDRNDSISTTTTGGGSHYIGPDDKAAGGDLGWDISLSWGLADLVWSTDQTTIDSRSKLMVELRDDILDQVTRLYFERRRIQIELLTADTLEPLAKLERKMRIDELTALIDGLRGGELSAAIKSKSTIDRKSQMQNNKLQTNSNTQ